MATPPTQCPCDLSREEARSCIDTKGRCRAEDADGIACGRRLADHPREAELTTPQAQGN